MNRLQIHQFEVMDKTLALSWVARGQAGLVKAAEGLAEYRAALSALKAYQGWRALGYNSFEACGQAVFGKGRSQLHRDFKAAEIEEDLRLSPVGYIEAMPERKLRPLAPLDPPARRAAWKSASANGTPTAAQVEAAALVEQLRSNSVSPEEKEAIIARIGARQKADSARVDLKAELTHYQRASYLWPQVVRHMRSAAQKAVRANRHGHKVTAAADDVEQLGDRIVARIERALAECGVRKAAA